MFSASFSAVTTSRESGEPISVDPCAVHGIGGVTNPGGTGNVVRSSGSAAMVANSSTESTTRPASPAVVACIREPSGV
ncbi:hypothetical protein CH253_04295 [Rhodococcus sp. 06-156-3C]|nr:hypothetical protein CH280_08275 [Rhodococcus sp. 06-156-4C]OZD24061.1 hypothetical protein CH247_29260 [Rhodococcus sp. 06-156-3b]OZD25234.1 hypothetical protein CH253_04295 [Rhodococcus sp. 06-156-3C]OZD40178.1 hypothetical protein CH284_04020 [Rhodococcus sp. 06-156-3]OZF66691.1 hypothetical protein CH290_07905 [Rhodococcus sp. 06-156-4]